MKVSVIVANYNHAHFLEQSVKSVLNQTYHDYEIVIVDDGSSDGSQNVIKKLVGTDNRIVEPILLPKNKGKWCVLNTAIEQRCTGKLVTAQDADDVAHPQRLQRQVEALQMSNAFHLLCGFHHCHNEDDVQKNLQTHFSEPIKPENIMKQADVLKSVHQGFKHPQIKQFWTGDFECHGATALFYKQLWDHGMRFNPPKKGLRITWSEDSDFNIRLCLLLQNTAVLKEKLYLYRRNTSTHGTGLSVNDCSY